MDLHYTRFILPERYHFITTKLQLLVRLNLNLSERLFSTLSYAVVFNACTLALSGLAILLHCLLSNVHNKASKCFNVNIFRMLRWPLRYSRFGNEEEQMVTEETADQTKPSSDLATVLETIGFWIYMIFVFWGFVLFFI